MALTGHPKYFVKQPLVLMVLNDTSFQTHCSRLVNIFALSVKKVNMMLECNYWSILGRLLYLNLGILD